MNKETVIVLVASKEQKKVEGYAWLKTASLNSQFNWNDSGCYYRLTEENRDILAKNPVGIFNATYTMKGGMSGNVMCYVEELELVQSFNEFA